MDFGIDTLVYIIIGAIFVWAQATRKRKLAKGTPQAPAPVEQVEQEETKEELSAFWKEFLGTDLTANQVDDPVLINPVPHVVTEPADFHRSEPAVKVPVFPKSSFNEPGDRADAGIDEPALHSDEELPLSGFNLRSAVVYSVILERKYV
jgi:hypothetical protein